MNIRLYKVGKYLRLSQESNGYRNGEQSASIENQDAMLTRFIGMMPGWLDTRTYIDDGASGANFNRQGFRDMMDDIRAGVIDLVLVKDLSRFGRNYLEAGRYLEEELPALGCRFVALSDGIDTETGENDIIPFLNAINDFYVRDVSERIKSVMLAKAKEGHKLTGATPYGYQRNPNERHRLILDEYAAGVVRKIFELRAEGVGYTGIAGEFNKAGIPPPRLYYFIRQGRETTAVTTETWTVRTVKLMLNNEVYIGNTVSLKRGTRSYRDSREYRRDESEWIRVENTHPAIVNADTWDKVQALNLNAKKSSAAAREPQRRLFAGLLICPDCNAKMGYEGSDAKCGGYVCRTYSRSGRVACSSHRISERSLKALVLGHIRDTAAQITLDEGEMLESLRVRLLGSQRADKSIISKEIRSMEQRLHTMDAKIEQLYEDKVTGRLSADEFSITANEIETSREITENRLELLRESITEAENKLSDIEKWASLLKKNSTLDEVDREMLEALIDKIEIGKRVVENGVTAQDVRIFYKYVGLC